MTPDFLGYTYCPVRDLFRATIHDALAAFPDDDARRDYQAVMPNGHKGENHWPDLWQETRPHALPQVLTSAGFSHFFQPQFMQRHLATGHYVGTMNGPANTLFADAGIDDPLGWYGVYALFPLVMLIDHDRLGNRPVPRAWSDLLDPVYHQQIIIGGSQGNVHEDLMLYLHQAHGIAAVRAFAANVKSAMHGAQMAKLAGSGSDDGAAIYVISWLFGRCCCRPNIQLLWPQEGAVVTPMTIMRKPDCSALSQHLFDTVAGPVYGAHTARNFMPARHPAVDNRLPDGARVKWLGWDYIRSHSIPDLMQRMAQEFHRHCHADFRVGGVAHALA